MSVKIKKAKKVPVGFSIDKSVKELFTATAASRGTDMSFLVEVWMRAYNLKFKK